jgi:hypothetical protein
MLGVARRLVAMYMWSLGCDFPFVFHMHFGVSIVVRHCGAFPEPHLPRGDSTVSLTSPTLRIWPADNATV